jgi:hypothetical protein
LNKKRHTAARMSLVAVAASSALVLGACGGGAGQQGGTAQGGETPGGAATSSCALAGQVVNDMKTYAGKQVTVTGTVGQVIGPHAMTLTSSGNTPGATQQTVLVVVKDTASLAAGSPVQVTGKLEPAFSTEQAAAFTGGTLDQAAFAAYNGKPYIQAVFAGPASANISRGEGGILGIGSSGCGSANQVLSDMRSYTGQQVTITAAIGEVINPHAITIMSSGNAQGATPQTVLIVTKDAMSLTAGSPVEITGKLEPAFSTDQAAAFTGATLDRAAFAAYEGKPYIQAAFIGPVSANLSGGQGAG